MMDGQKAELTRMKLYPLLFEPNLHEVVWGGEKLTAWKGLAVRDHIGESWEVSCVESSPSVIANGAWAGCTLSEVIDRQPEEYKRKVADGTIVESLAKHEVRVNF